MAVYEHLAILTQDTDVHASGMSIDTTVKLMWVGIEAPEVSSFLGNLNFPLPAVPLRCAEGGGLNHYQSAAADGGA
jgi:hypothetical protein